MYPPRNSKGVIFGWTMFIFPRCTNLSLSFWCGLHPFFLCSLIFLVVFFPGGHDRMEGWKKPRFNLCFDLEKTHQDGVRRGIQKPGWYPQPTVNSPRTSLMFQSWRCGGFLQTWNFAAAFVGDPRRVSKQTGATNLGFYFEYYCTPWKVKHGTYKSSI